MNGASVAKNAEIFEDPDNFKPDRWSKDTSTALHPFSAVPFGFGPRSCYGMWTTVSSL